MKEKDKILVSIVTVVYNGEEYIEGTIESVLNQTYSNIEYIIIDGKSTDNTVQIIKKYQDKLAYWISEPDRGIYDAMNKGLKKCNGELIGIINADDWYELDAIKNIVNLYVKNKNIDIFYGLLRYIKNSYEYMINAQNHIFLDERMIPHPSTFIKKEVYQMLNYYSLSYKSASDYDFMLRAKKSKVSFLKTDKVIANFRMEGISTTSKIGAIESLKIKYKYKYINKQTFILKFLFFKLREFL